MRINKLTLLLLAPMCLFSCNKGVTVTLVNEDENIGIISKGGTFNPGTTVIFGAQVNSEQANKKLFRGWYKVEDDEKEYAISYQNPWIYKVPEQNIKIKAKWIDYYTQSFIFNYYESSKSLSISNYFGRDENIIVPSTRYDINVNRIEAYTFAGLSNAQSIDIKDNITSIGDYAFMNSNLKEITLPSNLTDINQGNNIFYGWTKNQTINLHKSNLISGISEIITKWGWELEDSGGVIKEKASSTTYTCGSKDVVFEIID